MVERARLHGQPEGTFGKGQPDSGGPHHHARRRAETDLRDEPDSVRRTAEFQTTKLCATCLDGSNPIDYVYFGGRRLARVTSSTAYYYLQDHLGSARAGH
jgi:hypothetical protein